MTLHTPANKQLVFGDGFAQVSPPEARSWLKSLYKTQGLQSPPPWLSQTHFALGVLRYLLASRHEGALRGLCCAPAFLLGHPR